MFHSDVDINSNHLQNLKNYNHLVNRQIHLLISIHKFWNHCFVIYGEALQFEAAVPQLHTFHMDLHPSIKKSSGYCLDLLHLNVMQIFKLIGKHLHIGTNKRHI